MQASNRSQKRKYKIWCIGEKQPSAEAARDLQQSSAEELFPLG
jgi:hypothetical protein